jgi:hypothetical protein
MSQHACAAHARTHARTRTHTHARTRTQTHTHARAHTHTHTHDHRHAHARTYARTYARTHTRMHAHTHVHSRTHVHARTHEGMIADIPIPLLLWHFHSVGVNTLQKVHRAAEVDERVSSSAKKQPGLKPHDPSARVHMNRPGHKRRRMPKSLDVRDVGDHLWNVGSENNVNKRWQQAVRACHRIVAGQLRTIDHAGLHGTMLHIPTLSVPRDVALSVEATKSNVAWTQRSLSSGVAYELIFCNSLCAIIMATCASAAPPCT